MDVELAQVRDYLAEVPPFDTLPAAVLDGLPTRMQIRYARRGTALMKVGEPNEEMFLLRSGAVDIRDSAGALVERGAEGTCFGTTTVIDGLPSRFDVVTIEDSLVYVLPAADWHHLAGEHASFREFFVGQRQSRMRGALASVQVADSGSAIMRTRVSDMIGREPVTAPSTVSVREAAEVMARENVSSLLIMDSGNLVGIVSDRDLRSRVVAAGLDTSRPVRDVMTSGVMTASPDDLAFEVLLRMMDGRIHHLPVWQALPAPGRAVGVVTSTDLMRLEHANPIYLVRDVNQQTSLDGLTEVAGRLPGTVTRLVSQDVSASDVGRVITAVGDAITRRLLAMAEERLGPPPVPYTWVALGSQARLEQVLGSDQDHAIITADEATDEHIDGYFLDLATFVVDGLEAAGYPRCDGDVMATAAKCRMRWSDWRTSFSRWIRETDPDAVLASGIFFDARPIHGEAELVTSLLETAVAMAADTPRFLVILAKRAAQHTPPIGFFRNFVLSDAEEHRDRFDIKWGGVGAVQESARVLSLASGSTAVGTLERLEAATFGNRIGAERATSVADAYEFIAHVRLSHQVEQIKEGRAPDNLVNPADLTSFEKRHLREAFREVRALQTFLDRSYARGGA